MTAHNFKDVSGQFGWLTVLRYYDTHRSPSGKSVAMFECECRCGKIIQKRGSDLRKREKQGRVQSCGCLRSPILTGTVQGDLTIGEIVGHDSSRSRIYSIACSCGNVFEASHLKGRTACTACLIKKKVERNAPAVAERAAAKKAARLAEVEAKTITTESVCIVCLKDFTHEFIVGSVERLYCTDACAQRARRSVSRNRVRARQFKVRYEPVNSYLVFRRDGYICQSCGYPVDPRLRAAGWKKHPRSAELDHRVPMENGGPSVESNCETICADCHSKKCIWERLSDSAVVCVETGESYVSLAEMARAYKVSRGTVADAIRTNKDGRWKGLTIRSYDKAYPSGIKNGIM